MMLQKTVRAKGITTDTMKLLKIGNDEWSGPIVTAEELEAWLNNPKSTYLFSVTCSYGLAKDGSGGVFWVVQCDSGSWSPYYFDADEVLSWLLSEQDWEMRISKGKVANTIDGIQSSRLVPKIQ